MDSESKSGVTFPKLGLHWWIAAVLLCVVYAFSHSYSSMAKYDDESYVMMTIDTFLDGDRLYAETYTQYGPAYYMIQKPIHGFLGVPITHDIVRLKTIFCWLLIGGLGGLIVGKLTGQSFAGMAAFLLAFVHLENLGLEPAHPQEIVAVLSLICLCLMRTENRAALFFAGFFAAVAALAKLNVGAVAAASCLFAAGFSQLGNSRSFRLFSLFGCLIPLGLAAGVLWSIAKKALASGQLQTLGWPLMIFVSTAILCITAFQALREKQAVHLDDQPKGWLHWLTGSWPTVAGGGIIGTVLVVLWAMSHGNSLYEIMFGVVLQHSFMSEWFYHPMRLVMGGILIALVAVVFLAARVWFKIKDINANVEAIDRVLLMCSPFVLLASMALMAIDCWRPLVHGLNPRGAGHFLSTVGPVLMPVLLIRKVTQFRLALAMLGCLSPILAFPVPGTQVALGTLPILLGVVVASFDAAESRIVVSPLPFKLCRLTSVLIASIALISTTFFAYRWSQFTPLNQPGCRWVRIEPDRAKTEIAVADAIRDTETKWLAFDKQNHNRFFYWTGKRPLTSISPTLWPLMLTEPQKSRITSAARDADSICIVKVPNERLELSEHAPEIADQFFDSWTLLEQIDDWQIGITHSQ